ncbi:50S ribosomal protein L18 [Buchnera aphidicola]|uniref:50S ribosomal protein L18 n=1 Tax=Buchnera aphidicola TaxID=9 RepID=UPI003463A699
MKTSINKKIDARIRRSIKARKKMKQLNAIRLVIHRTSRHIYAQVISPIESKVLVTASTLEKDISNHLRYTGNKEAASAIGKIIAERALKKGIIDAIAFDRSGFRYHGRIKELAESAREAGLKF